MNEGIPFKPGVKAEQESNELEAIEQGHAWPTAEGLKSAEIELAFTDYLQNLSWDELFAFSDEIQNISREFGQEKESYESDIKSIDQKLDFVRNFPKWAALLTALPIANLPISAAIWYGGDALASVLENKLKGTSTDDLERVNDTKEHLNNLHDLYDLGSERKSVDEERARIEKRRSAA